MRKMLTMIRMLLHGPVMLYQLTRNVLILEWQIYDALMRRLIEQKGTKRRSLYDNKVTIQEEPSAQRKSQNSSP